MTFQEFNLTASLLEGLSAMGFNEPTPIQAQAIPVILENKDLIACAQTGTGKTAAYLLPIIHKLAESKDQHIDTLIIAPTRELAVQIDQQMEGFGYFTPVSSLAVYGGGDGNAFDREKQALKEGANIIIATPGKLISHLNMGYVKIDKLKHLILDEADRMLDMGFHDDIMKIISYLPKDRQTLLFSATMPPKIRDLANTLLKDPEQISLALSKPAERIFQAAFSVYDNQKAGLIAHLLSAKPLKSVIVFCSTKSSVKQIEKMLKDEKFNVASISSDLEQNERETVLRDFKNRTVNILVATDIVSRGIDIDSIDLVINYNVPGDAEDYIHRIGRTARASSKGVAFTFINEQDQFNFNKIETLMEKEVIKAPLPPHLGNGPIYDPSSKKPRAKNFGRKKPSAGRNPKRA